MAAVIVTELRVLDQDAFETYRTHAAKAIAAYGGRYVAGGGEIQTLEGSWQPSSILVVEFSSIEQARAWYNSAEYAPALAVRNAALSRNLIIVESYQENA